MKPLSPTEIVDLETYEKLRPGLLEHLIVLKRGRRLTLGDRVSLIFENRETVRFQVQEMLRVERIRAPERIREELDVYNALVPGENELSATLMIEITESARIRAELERLVGLDERVFLVLGEGAGAEPIQARFDPKQFEAERIAAVQYLKFSLRPEQIGQIRDGSIPLQLRIDHPHYRAQCRIEAPLRANLLADLEGEPEPLLRG